MPLNGAANSDAAFVPVTFLIGPFVRFSGNFPDRSLDRPCFFGDRHSATSSLSSPTSMADAVRALEPRSIPIRRCSSGNGSGLLRTVRRAHQPTDEDHDFFTFEISDHAVLCPWPDDKVRAFYNVCAHRGTRWCPERALQRGSPHHAWSHELDGRLRSEQPEAAVGFEASDVRLTEVRVEVFCGFIFVNLIPMPRRWKRGTPMRRSAGLRAVDRRSQSRAVDRDRRGLQLESHRRELQRYHCPQPPDSPGVVELNIRTSSRKAIVCGTPPRRSISHSSPTQSMKACLTR